MENRFQHLPYSRPFFDSRSELIDNTEERYPSYRRSFDAEAVTFEIYTRMNPDAPVVINLEEMGFLINDMETKIITHGFFGTGKSTWIIDMKNAYLSKCNCNIIVMDWGENAKNLLYTPSAKNTLHAGKIVAEFVNHLSKFVTSDKIHLIGHSLGAHVMGVGGRYALSEVYRITGLDPAGPEFRDPEADIRRIGVDTANFVDIIHTSSSAPYGFNIGFRGRLGHADFFPNGGEYQPGCQSGRRGEIGCSHTLAHEFFTESITSGVGFHAYPCDSWPEFVNQRCKENPVLMGDPVSLGANGSYFLYTRSERPYANGPKTTPEPRDVILI